jgi:hypothetical protein
LGVIGEHQFEGDSAHLPKFFGMRFNFHTGLGSGGTGGDDTESFDIDETESAGTVDAQFGVVAEGWNVNTCFSGKFQ